MGLVGSGIMSEPGFLGWMGLLGSGYIEGDIYCEAKPFQRFYLNLE